MGLKGEMLVSKGLRPHKHEVLTKAAVAAACTGQRTQAEECSGDK